MRDLSTSFQYGDLQISGHFRILGQFQDNREISGQFVDMCTHTLPLFINHWVVYTFGRLYTLQWWVPFVKHPCTWIPAGRVRLPSLHILLSHWWKVLSSPCFFMNCAGSRPWDFTKFLSLLDDRNSNSSPLKKCLWWIYLLIISHISKGVLLLYK